MDVSKHLCMYVTATETWRYIFNLIPTLSARHAETDYSEETVPVRLFVCDDSSEVGTGRD